MAGEAGAASANAGAFASVGDLTVEADAALAAEGNTPSGDPNRAYQEELKDAIEGANKNLTFVQAGPEECPAPF